MDDVADLTRPAHSVLLRAGIPIVEHLTALDQLPPSGFRFFSVVPKFRGVGTFPVRAFAIT
jgi:kynurenine formamidase